jgi:hypothetical protein
MTDAIRARLEDEMSYHRADCCGESDEPCNGTRMVAALRAVLDLCDPDDLWRYCDDHDCRVQRVILAAIADALGVSDD